MSPPFKSRINKGIKHPQYIKLKNKKYENNSKLDRNKNKIKRNNFINNNINKNNFRNNLKTKNFLNNDKNYKKYKAILNYNDNEMNDLEYEEAIKSDRRSYIQYYLSLLRVGHLFIFSFYCNKRDYNIQIIKIFLFFFFFAVDLFINALFFSDATMHQIYEDDGIFNFIYQIPQIIYSTLISSIINKLITFLSLSESKVLDIKKPKTVINLHKGVLRILKIKFMLFFIITFLMLLFFLYYVSCFCGVYVNTQIHLIKDTAISFSLSMVYPFAFYLIPGIFRILALRDKKKGRKCIYKLSQVIGNF